MLQGDVFLPLQGPLPFSPRPERGQKLVPLLIIKPLTTPGLHQSGVSLPADLFKRFLALDLYLCVILGPVRI